MNHPEELPVFLQSLQLVKAVRLGGPCYIHKKIKEFGLFQAHQVSSASPQSDEWLPVRMPDGRILSCCLMCK